MFFEDQVANLEGNEIDFIFNELEKEYNINNIDQMTGLEGNENPLWELPPFTPSIMEPNLQTSQISEYWCDQSSKSFNYTDKQTLNNSQSNQNTNSTFVKSIPNTSNAPRISQPLKNKGTQSLNSHNYTVLQNMNNRQINQNTNSVFGKSVSTTSTSPGINQPLENSSTKSLASHDYTLLQNRNITQTIQKTNSVFVESVPLSSHVFFNQEITINPAITVSNFHGITQPNQISSGQLLTSVNNTVSQNMNNPDTKQKTNSVFLESNPSTYYLIPFLPTTNTQSILPSYSAEITKPVQNNNGHSLNPQTNQNTNSAFVESNPTPYYFIPFQQTTNTPSILTSYFPGMTQPTVNSSNQGMNSFNYIISQALCNSQTNSNRNSPFVEYAPTTSDVSSIYSSINNPIITPSYTPEITQPTLNTSNQGINSFNNISQTNSNRNSSFVKSSSTTSDVSSIVSFINSPIISPSKSSRITQPTLNSSNQGMNSLNYIISQALGNSQTNSNRNSPFVEYAPLTSDVSSIYSSINSPIITPSNTPEITQPTLNSSNHDSLNNIVSRAHNSNRNSPSLESVSTFSQVSSNQSIIHSPIISPSNTPRISQSTQNNSNQVLNSLNYTVSQTNSKRNSPFVESDLTTSDVSSIHSSINSPINTPSKSPVIPHSPKNTFQLKRAISTETLAKKIFKPDPITKNKADDFPLLKKLLTGKSLIHQYLQGTSISNEDLNIQ